jgi:hypothetical protein
VNGGTFTHSNGTCVFSNSSGTADIYAASGALSLYNVSISGTSIRNYTTTLTIANDLAVDASKIFLTNVAAKVLVVTGLTRSYGTITCGSAACTFGSGYTANFGLIIRTGGTFTGGSGTHLYGALSIYSGATFTATSGNTTIDSASSDSGCSFATGGTGAVFTHSNGTFIFTRAGTQLLWDTNNLAQTFYNLQVNNAACVLKQHDTYVLSLVVANTLTITAGTLRLNATGAAVSLTLGTSSAKGSITILGTLDFTANATNAITIKAASSAYPCEVDGTPDWDAGGALSKVSITDLILQDAQTIGTATVTVTATRVRFDGVLTVTTATLVGSDCVIDASTTTVSSGLYIEGWYDPTETTRGGHDWILIGGAYTLAADKTYSGWHFYKMAGATLTFSATYTMTLTDCDLDGTYIILASSLVDTNSGTVIIQFTFDLFVSNIAGAGVDAATVTVYDVDGNVLVTTTTSSGEITTQTILYATFAGTTVVEYPHRLTVSKTGYGSLSYILTIDEPKRMDILLSGTTSGTGTSAWLKESIIIYRKSSLDDYGHITYDSGTTVDGRLEQTETEVRNTDGELMKSTCSIHVGGSTSVDTDDKVTLPDGSTHLVISVKNIKNAKGGTAMRVIYT